MFSFHHAAYLSLAAVEDAGYTDPPLAFDCHCCGADLLPHRLVSPHDLLLWEVIKWRRAHAEHTPALITMRPDFYRKLRFFVGKQALRRPTKTLFGIPFTIAPGLTAPFILS